MGKDALKPQDIYNELRNMFPGEYLPLKKMKPSLPRRGEKPRPPERMIHDTQTLGPDSTYQDVGRMFAEMPSNSFRVTVQREQIGKEEYQDFDWSYNSSLGEEERVEWIAERPIYGERIVGINISASYERPDWNMIYHAWKQEVAAWENAGRRYKERELLIRETRTYNNQLMEDARKNNHQRWVMVARQLKGLRSPEYLLKTKERLEKQLADIESLIGEQDA